MLALSGYTLLLLGGRQPLCGIGVTSLMTLISSPAACKERMADSRPEPGPLTHTSTLLTPYSSASLAQASAATPAAKGVDFLEPLKPTLPADLQLITFPRLSVMVTVVLLKVALTWAMPFGSTRPCLRSEHTSELQSPTNLV